jgi:hypothetical protein
MVEGSISGPIPQAGNLPRPAPKTQASGERAAAAEKTAPGSSAGRAGGRQQKLVVHLVVGLLMAVIPLAGYAIFGPHVGASASQTAGNQFVDGTSRTSVNASSSPAMTQSQPVSDMATMYAEMEAITRQMNALQQSGIPQIFPDARGMNVSPNGMVSNSTAPDTHRLNQMMAELHTMMAQVNSTGGQPGVSSNHTGHH